MRFIGVLGILPSQPTFSDVPSGVNRNLSGEKRNFCRVRPQLCT
jgi:hypothetical protein